MNDDIIYKFFPDFSPEQHAQFAQLGNLYADWNSKINVISRKDIDNLYTNHVLHSLAIAAFLGNLAADTTFFDVGTGGGFPGIPLAIAYPQCQFHLIDRIGKKIRVASEIANAIQLKNVTFQHGDVKECHQKFDYIVSRAVMPLNNLVKLVAPNAKSKQNAVLGNKYPPALVCLKGGDITAECQGIRQPVVSYPVSEFINIDRFYDKQIIYVKLC